MKYTVLFTKELDTENVEYFFERPAQQDDIEAHGYAKLPVPLVLHCPQCKARHIDLGENAMRSHRTHACQSCGLLWAPAVVPTVGVRFLPGCKDSEGLSSDRERGPAVCAPACVGDDAGAPTLGPPPPSKARQGGCRTEGPAGEADAATVATGAVRSPATPAGPDGAERLVVFARTAPGEYGFAREAQPEDMARFGYVLQDVERSEQLQRVADFIEGSGG